MRLKCEHIPDSSSQQRVWLRRQVTAAMRLNGKARPQLIGEFNYGVSNNDESPHLSPYWKTEWQCWNSRSWKAELSLTLYGVC